MVSAQTKVMGKGLDATLVRSKERQETALTLYHNFEAHRLPTLLKQLHNLMPMGVSLVLAPTSGTAADLAKAEQHISTLVDEKRELQKQVAAMQAELDALRGTAPAGTEWITLTRAAKKLNVSYATLWRAHHDQRLVTKVIGGKAKDQLLCDPSSFRRKGR